MMKVFFFFIIEGIGKAQGMWEFRGLKETGVFSVLVCVWGGGVELEDIALHCTKKDFS